MVRCAQAGVLVWGAGEVCWCGKVQAHLLLFKVEDLDLCLGGCGLKGLVSLLQYGIALLHKTDGQTTGTH